MPSPSKRQTAYSIASVSRLTGIGCHALRVWERRYGYPVPHRSPSGHRRYGADQVRVLCRVAQLIQDGQAIGELMEQVRAGTLDVPEPAVADPAPAELVDRLMAADLEGAQAVYDRAAGAFDVPTLLDRVIEPALVEAGERWFRRDCGVFQEHTATSFLRRKLFLLLDAAQRANPHPARRVLVGTVQGDRHEGGVLSVCVRLELAGWRALVLGTDQPAAEFQKAINLWEPDALALSFVLSRNINKRFDELAKLRGVPIFLGGRSILNYQGLARRHGFVPLPGPAALAVPQLMARCDGKPETPSGGAP